ncbi:MAG: ATP-binding cassette domain-containing protein, partial [Egibacteraceae bacterium]
SNAGSSAKLCTVAPGASFDASLERGKVAGRLVCLILILRGGGASRHELLCGGWVVIGLLLVREASSLGRASRRAAPELRRADYYRLLAVEPEAAKEIRVFGLQGWVRERFRGHRQAGLRILWDERRRQDWAKFILLVGVMAPIYAWIFLTIVFDAVEGRISVASMAIYLQAAMAVRAFTDQVNQGGAMRERAQAVPVALDLQRRVTSRYPRLRSDDLPVPDRIEEIAFEDVHFCYPGSSRAVLDGLTFTLPGRGSAALVGENGAGKTTAVKLLLRLYDPSSGRILVNGTDLRRLDLDQWRAACATVFQDFQRYPFSARDNLVLGGGQAQ